MQLLRRNRWVVAALLISGGAAVFAAAVQRKRPAPDLSAAADPLAYARAAGPVVNREATVPPMCYTKTAGTASPCWTCHTVGAAPNHLDDSRLQQEYAFSGFALDNHWKNLFADPRPAIRRTSDAQIIAWIRTDNYRALRDALATRADYAGYRPDIELIAPLGAAPGAVFDDAGFARDGSDWRALRYQPFPGTFWPSNGSAGDVLLRLPAAFRSDADGRPSRAVYQLNLALLEAAMAAPPGVALADLEREVEPLDEGLAGIDLDADGRIGGTITRIRGLPAHYLGGAAAIALERAQAPAGLELLHTVRYLDPDAPTLLSRRLKELRYMRKTRSLDNWGRIRQYELALDEKQDGVLPRFAGAPEVGFANEFGWQLQAFIEDARGNLRLQTAEEHLACMGCHTSLGVTVDQTFSLARKVPGAAGWRHQDLRGLHDRPQLGHSRPEVLTYFERTTGGDELRANDELLARFFDARGAVREAEVRRAAPGGDRDLAWLLAPSRARALALDKAYLGLVRQQRFDLGRLPLLGPTSNVHARIDNGSTDLAATGKTFTDGRLQLDWR